MTKSSAASAILIAVVVSVLLVTGLVAAQPDRNTNSDTIQNANGRSTSSQNMNSSTLDSSDRKFMMEAGMGGMAEVEWARVALQRASSDSVKQYAQQMIDDHTKAGDALKQLASTKGVALETALDNKQSSMLAKLQGLSGADFDRTYLKEAGVKAHEKMEKLFMREADRGKDADVKAFASATLPTVQAHLRMAREMMTSMSGNKNTSMSGGNSNMSGNMNTSGNSNMSGNMNSNASGNMNTSNSNDNMSGNMNTSGNSNMAGNMNSNVSENSNMSGNSNTMNANGNSNTSNANGNSNTPRRRR